MSRFRAAGIAAAILLAVISVMAAGCGTTTSAKSTGVPAFETPYQAVLLDTGLVYYGKLSGMDSGYPTLKDVYYIQNKTDPQSKQVSSVLIRRGNEWHGPSMTVLNARHIVLVEPVGPTSKVAQLIAEEQAKQQK